MTHLLLLSREGKTVYFGELGEKKGDLVVNFITSGLGVVIPPNRYSFLNLVIK